MQKLRKFYSKIKFRVLLKPYLIAIRKRKKFKHNFMMLKLKLSKLHYKGNFFSDYIFKDLPINFEIFFKQYNMYRLIEPDRFNFHILKNEKIIYPLLKEQLLLLKNNNFKVYSLLSQLLFVIYCLIEFCRGIFVFLFIFFSTIINLIKNKKNNDKYLYIKNLSSNEIINNQENRNFRSWIEKKFKLNNFKLVHDNRKHKNLFIYNRFLIPELISLSELMKFLFFFLKFNFFIFLDLILFRYRQFSFYSEIIKFCSSLSKDKEELKNSYFFFNTNAFFRPLNTYELGLNVFYFEYSTNNILIYYENEHHSLVKNNNKQTSDLFTLNNSSWENYIISDDIQKKQIQKNQLINAKYFNFGPIPFGPSKKIDDDLNIDNSSILIFDSIAFRNSFIFNSNNPNSTYLDKNIIKFLNDISLLNEKNSLYLKLKRNINFNYYSKKYLKYLDKSNIILLDHRYDPEEIIAKFDKVICLPFSTTALIAKKLGKKVCYYDVCEIHSEFDELFKEIPIIRNISKLKKWSNE